MTPTLSSFTSAKPPRMPSPAAIMPCAQFLTTGFCKFGTSCLFSHDLHSEAWMSTYHPHYLPPAYEPVRRLGGSSIPASSPNTSPCSQPATLRNASSVIETRGDEPPIHPQGHPTSNAGKRRRSRRRGHGQSRPGNFTPFSGSYAQPLTSYYPGFFSHPPEYPYLGSLDRRNTFGVDLLADVAQTKTARGNDCHLEIQTESSTLDCASSVDSSARSESTDFELDDSDDTEASDHRVIVEHTSDVHTYQGARVGVLGGGVKLGMSGPGLKPRKSTLQISTKEDATFDSDAEMEPTMNSRAEPNDPQSVPLPPSPDMIGPDEDEEVIIFMDSAPTVRPSETLPIPVFSWAEDETDDSYLDSSLPTFGTESEVPLPAALTLSADVAVPRPIVKTQLSYAGVVAANPLGGAERASPNMAVSKARPVNRDLLASSIKL